MANLTRFNTLDDPFEDIFRGFFVRPLSIDQRAQAAATFKVDVTETEREYRLHAEIPGVKKEDINVTIDGSQVAISAEVKREKDVKEGGKVLRSERHYGRVYRAFALDQEVDEGGACAKYADGVLELTLPKKAVSAARRLAIN